MAKLKQAGIRFDLETYQWLEAEAEKTRTPISALVREAGDYLLVNQSEALHIKQVYQGVCATEEKPLVLTRDTLVDRLFPEHIISLSTPAKNDEGRDNLKRAFSDTLANIKPTKASQSTAKRDPDELKWQPTDETREMWEVVQS